MHSNFESLKSSTLIDDSQGHCPQGKNTPSRWEVTFSTFRLTLQIVILSNIFVTFCSFLVFFNCWYLQLNKSKRSFESWFGKVFKNIIKEKYDCLCTVNLGIIPFYHFFKSPIIIFLCLSPSQNIQKSGKRRSSKAQRRKKYAIAGIWCLHWPPKNFRRLSLFIIFCGQWKMFHSWTPTGADLGIGKFFCPSTDSPTHEKHSPTFSAEFNTLKEIPKTYFAV